MALVNPANILRRNQTDSIAALLKAGSGDPGLPANPGPPDPYVFTPHYTGGARDSNPNIGLPKWGYLGPGNPGVDYDHSIIGGEWSPTIGGLPGSAPATPTDASGTASNPSGGSNAAPYDPSTPGWNSNDAFNLVGWNPPSGVTGFGTTAPSGVYAPGGGPTAVDTYWADPSSLGGVPPGSTAGPGASGGSVSFGANGGLQGGYSGSQGTIYGQDPNTGNPIYNATGSPAPGFFDSKTGKFVENVAAAAANVFVPGLGFVAKAIADAIHARNIAKNTGTDLTRTQGNPDSTNAPAAADNTGPAWFQPGYQPPAGIQQAIARGDYSTAYGQSPESASNNFQMWSQGMLQPTNHPTVQDGGKDSFVPNAGAPMGHFNPETGGIERVAGIPIGSTFTPRLMPSQVPAQPTLPMARFSGQLPNFPVMGPMRGGG